MADYTKKFISTWFYAGHGIIEEKPLLGKPKNMTSRSLPDFDYYGNKLATIYEEFDANGYDVVNVVPIAMGDGVPLQPGSMQYSITRGAVVIGKRRG
jgi:hypothetical protein